MKQPKSCNVSRYVLYSSLGVFVPALVIIIEVCRCEISQQLEEVVVCKCVQLSLEMKMWKLSHTDVCDCGERQTMSHLITRGDVPNCTWTDLAMPTFVSVNCAKHWEESI